MIKIIIYDLLCSFNRQVKEKGQYGDFSCCEHNSCPGSSSSNHRAFDLESKENKSKKTRWHTITTDCWHPRKGWQNLHQCKLVAWCNFDSGIFIGSTIWTASSRNKDGSEGKDHGDDLELPVYDFETIAAATEGFSTENKLGEGGFGPVYKVKILT